MANAKDSEKVFSHQVMKVKISTNICQTYPVLITYFPYIWKLRICASMVKWKKKRKNVEQKLAKSRSKRGGIETIGRKRSLPMYSFKHTVPQNVSLPTNWLLLRKQFQYLLAWAAITINCTCSRIWGGKKCKWLLLFRCCAALALESVVVKWGRQKLGEK